jgi:hypothetical protein
MLLYHGTSEWALREANILEKGLQPRGLTGVNNWEHTSASNPEAVYLTNTYACHFATMAWRNAPRIPGAEGKISKRIAVIEIDTSRLTPGRFHPDEDAMEQLGRGRDSFGTDVVARTAVYRALAKNSPDWEKSLNELGTCAYYGTILPRHFTRVAYFDRKSNPAMFHWMIDGVVNVVAFKLCGKMHQSYIKWLFGEPVTPNDVSAFGHVEEEEVAQIQEVLDTRAGVEVVNLR